MSESESSPTDPTPATPAAATADSADALCIAELDTVDSPDESELDSELSESDGSPTDADASPARHSRYRRAELDAHCMADLWTDLETVDTLTELDPVMSNSASGDCSALSSVALPPCLHSASPRASRRGSAESGVATTTGRVGGP